MSDAIDKIAEDLRAKTKESVKDNRRKLDLLNQQIAIGEQAGQDVSRVKKLAKTLSNVTDQIMKEL